MTHAILRCQEAGEEGEEGEKEEKKIAEREGGQAGEAASDETQQIGWSTKAGPMPRGPTMSCWAFVLLTSFGPGDRTSGTGHC